MRPSGIWPEHIPFWNGRLQADSCQQQGQFQFVMPVTTDIAFLKTHRLVMIHLKGEKCHAVRTELTKIFIDDYGPVHKLPPFAQTRTSLPQEKE